MAKNKLYHISEKKMEFLFFRFHEALSRGVNDTEKAHRGGFWDRGQRYVFKSEMYGSASSPLLP
jgi:hypothetical protein